MTDSTFSKLRKLFVLLYLVLIVSPNAVARFKPHKRSASQLYLYDFHKQYEMSDFAAKPASGRVLRAVPPRTVQLATKLSF
jgi:hypothetical protein